MKVLMYEQTGLKGLFQYSLNLSEALSRGGCEVSLLTSSSCQFTSSNVEMIKELHPVELDRWHMKFKPFLFASKLSRVISNSRKRHSVSKNLQPDIIHLQLTKPIVDQFCLPLLSRHFKIVLTVHDVRYHDPGNINNRKSFLRRTYCSAHHLIVHTKKNKDQLTEEFPISPEKVSIIPHGAKPPAPHLPEQDTSRLSVGMTKAGPLILFLGNIRDNKGLDLLLEAMASVVSPYPEACLLIAGSLPWGESFNKYDSMIDSFGLRENVMKRVRFIEESEFDTLFQASDIVALPYRSFASQSGVLLQAYGYGKPVVVTDVGGLGELVRRDNTGIVTSPSPRSISSGIIRLIEDKEMYEEYSLNMTRAVKNEYGWEAVSGKTIEVYKKVMNITQR